MRTAQEVRDEKGRVLCPAGTTLSPEILERFAKMGVSYVTVEGHPVNFPWEKTLAEELAALEKRFSQALHPFLLELKEVLREVLGELHRESEDA
ncbi:hypothetical protein [Thermosulfurimonas marina]|nr:hypothetical protein [Thermosulfurimonas marina]